MSEVSSLIDRIGEEFAAHRQKVSQFREGQVQEHKARQQRLEQLDTVFNQLSSVWRPRLDALAAQFKDSVKVTPSITPGRRAALFQFQSPLARIGLQLSASTDTDVSKIVLAYDLNILPIYMEFEKHSEVAFPLDNIDMNAVGKWLDDRIVEFVKVYLSLNENEYYLREHMVEDPVAHVRFPKFVAGASLQRDGQTHYFISDDTKREFESR